VSVLPRLLESWGPRSSSTTCHGVTVMGVRRFELTRSSRAVKRAFDLLGASVGLLAVAPLMIAFAVAIKARQSAGRCSSASCVSVSTESVFTCSSSATMVDGADALKDSLRDRNEAQDGLFKIAGRSQGDPRRWLFCVRARWTSCRS